MGDFFKELEKGVKDVSGITTLKSGFRKTPPKSAEDVVTPFKTPGLVSDLTDGRISIERTGELKGLLAGVSDETRGLGGRIGKLLPQVEPGFGRLTESAMANLENVRRRTIGNLKENLQRRRVLGSSFGQDAISRAEAEFAQKGNEIKAQSFLQELEMKKNLMAMQTNTILSGMQTLINQINIEAGLGAQLSTGATAAVQAANQFQQEMDQREAEGAMELIGTIGGAAAGGA